MSEVRWIQCEPPAGKKCPAWALRACIDEKGTVFASPAPSDRDDRAALKAAWDGGIEMVSRDGHVYLPTGWLASEYFDDSEIYRLIELRVRTFAAASGEAI